jgi:hypothetical protein
VNSFGGDRSDLSLHPTVKPVAMVADAIRDCSHRKGIVLDAFVGSGTTLIAAEKTGRRGYGIEIDPAYCDVTIRRLRCMRAGGRPRGYWTVLRRGRGRASRCPGKTRRAGPEVRGSYDRDLVLAAFQRCPPVNYLLGRQI